MFGGVGLGKFMIAAMLLLFHLGCSSDGGLLGEEESKVDCSKPHVESPQVTPAKVTSRSWGVAQSFKVTEKITLKSVELKLSANRGGNTLTVNIKSGDTAPGVNLVATTTGLVGNLSPWRTFAFTDAVTLESGGQYWIDLVYDGILGWQENRNNPIADGASWYEANANNDWQEWINSDYVFRVNCS